MTIKFAPGDQKQVDVQLTPTTQPGQVLIDQVFIGVLKRLSSDDCDSGFNIQLINPNDFPVSGILHYYDWQKWFGTMPERHWDWDFNMDAGGKFQVSPVMGHIAYDTTYFRLAVEVGGVIVSETPKTYFVPGKQYEGSEKIAVGECTYTAPGLAVLWYSQRSDCTVWRGYYEHGDLHHVDFEYRTFDRDAWHAAFLCMYDPELIPGAEYDVYILGGASGGAWRDVYYSFTAA